MLSVFGLVVKPRKLINRRERASASSYAAILMFSKGCTTTPERQNSTAENSEGKKWKILLSGSITEEARSRE